MLKRNNVYAYIKRCVRIMLIGALSITMIGCATKKNELHKNDGVSDPTANKLKERNSNSETQEDTVNAMNEFACRLMSNLPQENFFFSPYSINVAMSMLDNGTDHHTKEEMDDVLGVVDLDGRNQNIKDLAHSINNDGVTLYTANSIWWQKSFGNLNVSAKTEFLEPIRYYFNSDIYEVDFDEKNTVNEINRWISDKTNKMISNMLTRIDAETIMCLMNAVYFEGEWNNKFNRKATHEQEFYGSNETVKVEMMNSGFIFLRYFEDDTFRAVELPYENSNIAMQLFLSKDEEPVWDRFSKLTISQQLDYMRELSDSEMRNISKLTIPKFKMDYKIENLPEILQSMGMIDAFDDERADFSKINDMLYVSDVLHEARIEVDEEGSNAAAATLDNTKLGCAMPEEIIEFIVDHPFLYTIRDRSTSIVLFMGYINQL